MTTLLIGGGLVTIGYLVNKIYNKEKNKSKLNDVEHLENEAVFCEPESTTSGGNINPDAKTTGTETASMFKPSDIVRSDEDAIKSNQEWKQIFSKLSNKYIDKKDFITNDSPWYKKKLTQNVDFNKPNLILAKMTGYDPDSLNSKEAIKPLFAPVSKLNNINGSDIYDADVKHRLNTSRYITGERPFEQIQVGPGINKGYISEGSGGFQQADTRDYVMPKTIDQLRTLNNPKLTYKGRVSAPKKSIDSRGKIGAMFKNKPEKVFAQTKDNYLITTGAIKRESGRSTIIIKNTNRKLSANIMGNPNTNIGGYDKNKKYKVSKKLSYSNDIVRNIEGGKKTTDYGKHSFFLDINKRNITELRTHTTNISKAVKSLIVPITDLMKNTIKETTEINTNTGNIALSTFIPNMSDKNNTQVNKTIRETLENRDYEGNINSENKGIYINDPNYIAKRTTKETTMKLNNFAPPVKESGDGYKTARPQVGPSNRDTMHNEYSGVGNSIHKEAMSYSDMYNAIINETREELLEGRSPTNSNVSLTSGSGNINLKIKKLEKDYLNDRTTQQTPTNYMGNNIDHYKNTFTSVKDKNVENTRFNPCLIDHMKTNPYVTQTFL